jgi:tRNA threonylcarbamoyladenosine biosynthesis protein TsaE
MNSCFLADEAATVTFGAILAQACKGRGLLTLQGNLGAGKTTLSRGLIQGLGHQGKVKSPTYTLVEPYETGNYRIFHYDLYRLSDPEELEFLGMREQLGNDCLTLVEWPEKGATLLPPADLSLVLALEGTGRRVSWSAGTPEGEAMVNALSHHNKS